MLKQEKVDLVNDFKNDLKDFNVVLVLSHKKLKFATIDQARRDATQNTRIKKVKNRLTKIAFKGTNYEALNQNLEQERILIMSTDLFDACKSAKFLLGKNKDSIQILQGANENETFDSQAINTIAQFESYKELQSQVLRVINVVGEKVLRVINAKFDNQD